jgi:hypothetical protein
MEKELKIGQNVRTVDFKRTRAFQFKSAAVWNWECPKLLKTVVTEPHHKLEPHFLQFNVECQEFEKLNTIESIWEYRLLVMVLAKNGKPYRMASCTFNATDPIDVMWEKILNTIHSSAKSVDSFQKFVNTVWDGKSPTVFRLDDNLIKTISESVKSPKILSADDFMRYLDTFKDDPRDWADATGEIEDIARMCTQIGKEIDGLDVSHAPARGFGKKGPFKTPTEWNKGYKTYIKDIFGKMSKRAQDMVVKNTHLMFND